MATLVQLGPAQDLMRAIDSPLGANTNTCPSDACATNSRPALSIVSPSGPIGAEHRTEAADLGDAAVLHEGQAPDRVVARHRHEQYGFAGIEHQAVGADAGVNKAVEPPVRRKAKNPPGRIVQPGLSLVGKIDVAA